MKIFSLWNSILDTVFSSIENIDGGLGKKVLICFVYEHVFSHMYQQFLGQNPRSSVENLIWFEFYSNNNGAELHQQGNINDVALIT